MTDVSVIVSIPQVVSTVVVEAGPAGSAAVEAAYQAGVATSQAGVATNQAGLAQGYTTSANRSAVIATMQAEISTGAAQTATTQAGLASGYAASASNSAQTATTQAGLAQGYAESIAGMDATIDGTGHLILTIGEQDPIDAGSAVGPVGATGPAGEVGPAGATGPGVATGGTTSQILAKKSNTSYDTEWVDKPVGATNLAVANKSSTTLDITSDTGTDATIPAATADDAGLLTAAEFTKLAGIETGATMAGATGDAFATSHLSAYTHGNIANGQTAYDWGNHASAGYLTSVTYGTTEGTACQGNDARLSDARTPVVTTLTDIGADLADADEIPVYDASDTATKKSALTRIWTYIAAKLASFTGDLTAKSISLNQNISQAAWTTSGVRVKNTAVTLTDTSSSGTVAAAYTNVWGGNTIAASNTTTFTDYATHYFNSPVAGSNVTITNAWAAIFNGNAKVSGDLSGPKLTEYTEKLYAVTTSGNVTISLTNGPFQRFVLDAARQFTMPSSPGAVACSFNMMLNCAGYTPTWNSTPTITWMTDDGTAPTLNTTTGKLNRLYFEWDNTTSAWLGYLLRAQA